jgi:hypothetical protein
MPRPGHSGAPSRPIEDVFQKAIAAHQPAVKTDQSKGQLQALIASDYASALGRLFSRRELHSFVKGLRLFLPRLNEEQFHWSGLKDLDRRASALGARLVATPFAGDDGTGLLGFYLNSGLADRALIYVNSAHHPAAIGAAFFHEAGHHLAALLLNQRHETLNYTFRPEYERHLDEPAELIADLLVCLEAYPKPAARRIFSVGSSPDGGLSTEVLERARQHLIGLGFVINNQILASDGRHYLSGMIHFLKLRAALYGRFGL